MRYIFISVLLIFMVSCTETPEVGSSCELLRPASEDVTKIEQKNLDCNGVDSDGLCLSYLGNSSYCTKKCGPDLVVTCDDISCEDGETCLNGNCYTDNQLCSADNLSGVCPLTQECNETGQCVNICSNGEYLINGVCVPQDQLCSGTNLTGVCGQGLECIEGECVPSGCPDGYICQDPIQLLGHPFKGVYVCIKSEESEPCFKQTCSDHGTCLVDESGSAYCQCDNGYISNGLNCEEDPCLNITCGGTEKGVCVSDSGSAVCDCQDGYKIDPEDQYNCILDQ